MKLEKILQDNRDAILRISAKHGAGNVRVFGSVARGQMGPDSDIDFLVDPEEGCSLMDLGGLLMDLQELLHRKVDIATEKGLHWYIRDKVIQEARPI
ncbi:MAG: nucleotidyltransferase family protein [Sedimentisphaerales bacterium]|nr:nucleotidyltransferase family protein [Sedimentisphaerales bacterium]